MEVKQWTNPLLKSNINVEPFIWKYNQTLCYNLYSTFNPQLIYISKIWLNLFPLFNLVVYHFVFKFEISLVYK